LHLPLIECKYCSTTCIKKGFYKSTQRLFCKTCQRYQQKNYEYKICTRQDEEMIVTLNNEGVGISSIARITGVSKANVVNNFTKQY